MNLFTLNAMEYMEIIEVITMNVFKHCLPLLVT